MTNRTNRGKSCVGVVGGATIRLRRVLRCVGRLAAIAGICVPTALLVLTDVGEVGLCGAPPAIGDQGKEQREGKED